MHVLSSLFTFIHASRARARVKRILISAHVDHPLTKRPLEKVKHAPRGQQPPGRGTLGGSMLDAHHGVNLQECADFFEHPGVK